MRRLVLGVALLVAVASAQYNWRQVWTNHLYADTATINLLYATLADTTGVMVTDGVDTLWLLPGYARQSFGGVRMDWLGICPTGDTGLLLISGADTLALTAHTAIGGDSVWTDGTDSTVIRSDGGIEIRDGNSLSKITTERIQLGYLSLADVAPGNNVVSGGSGDTATGGYAFVGGGSGNKAGAYGSVVSGGTRNKANGFRSTICGGDSNIAESLSASILGGTYNVVKRGGGTIGGGNRNLVTGFCATVPGGTFSQALGYASFAAGYSARALYDTSGAFGPCSTDRVNQWRFHSEVRSESLIALEGIRVGTSTTRISSAKVTADTFSGWATNAVHSTGADSAAQADDANLLGGKSLNALRQEMQDTARNPENAVVMGVPVYDWADYSQGTGICYGCSLLSSTTESLLVITSGAVFIKKLACDTARDTFMTVAQDTLYPLRDSVSYVVLTYSGGSVSYSLVYDRTTINATTQIIMGRAFREDAEPEQVYAVSAGNRTANASRLDDKRLKDRGGAERMTGGVISNDSNRIISSTVGLFYLGRAGITTPVKKSNIDSICYIYRDGSGGWTEHDSARVDNQRYDDGSGTLATLTAGRYGVHWVYVDYSGTLCILYGQGNYTLTNAENATVPASLPPRLSAYATLAAKAIIQKGSATINYLTSAYTTAFPVSAPSDHNDLGSLQGGTTSEYYHLTNSQWVRACTLATHDSVDVAATAHYADSSGVAGSAVDQTARDTAAAALALAKLGHQPGEVFWWYGDTTAEAFPAGAVVCDGVLKYMRLNGDSVLTPNLGGRFVVGANGFRSGAPAYRGVATGGDTLYTPAGSVDAHSTVGGASDFDNDQGGAAGYGDHTFTGTEAVICPPYYALWPLIQSRTW